MVSPPAILVAGVAAFEYLSARDPGRAVNVGLFSPDALAPCDQFLGREEWACRTGPDRVVFFNIAAGTTREFPPQVFLVYGHLP